MTGADQFDNSHFIISSAEMKSEFVQFVVYI